MKPFLSLFLFVFLIGIAFTASAVPLPEPIPIPNPLVSGDIPTLINKIADWLLGIGITVSTIIVLWAAFLFMTSGGNESRVTRARQTLWYAIIGLTILLLAKGVALLIQNILRNR